MKSRWFAATSAIFISTAALMGLLFLVGRASSDTFRATMTVTAHHSETDPVAVLASSTPFTLNLNLGPGDPTIDPALAVGGPSRFVASQLFLGLVRLNDDTGEPLPELATSWQMSPDAMIFTFTLRSGLTWTDGNPVTAYDVRYGILRSLDLVSNPDSDFPLFLIQNAQEYYEGTITDTDQVGITVLDYTHIRFSLNQAAAYFPGALADQPTARTMPQWAIEAQGVPTWTQPTNIVTNGPYRLIAWAHGVSMTLEKNTGYYDAANIQIGRVALQMLDDTTAWGMYQAGQLDSVRVPESEWSANLSDPLRRQELHFASQPAISHYGFNTAKAPFTSTLVRKAFIAAVNRQGVIDNVRRYAEQPALTFTPPGIWGHVDGFAEGVGIPYSPTQAKQWLVAAGYPNGQGLPPITLMYVTSTLNQSLAQYVRQNWIDNLGVSVTLSYTNPSDYYRLLRIDPPQIWRLTCLPGDYGYYDAYEFLNVCIYWFGRTPYGNWTNLTYDALLNLAARTADLNTRKSLYRQAEEILVETDAVELPLYYGANGMAAKPYLQRTYGSGGFGGHIADWRITRVITLPAVTTADPLVVTTGDRLTFTVLLSNTGNATTLSTVLTNPIPSGANYLAGTAWASSGIISDVGGIAWRGTVAPGQTITVTFGVSITAPAGSVITNTATISDGELAAPVIVSTAVIVEWPHHIYLPVTLKGYVR